MNDFIQVLTTTSRQEDAQRIARELIDRRLAGCVQISGPIESVYHWDGAVETAHEWQCAVKTTRAHYPAVEQCIRELHSYDTPEIIAVPIVAGSEAYLDWLKQMTGGGQMSKDE